MSAPWQAAILRELGAQPRTFPGVMAALLWFVVLRRRKMGGALDPSSGGCPTTAEKIHTREVTYARLSACMGPRDDADTEHDEPLSFADDPHTARDQAERRLEELARWYVSSAEHGQQRLADELGLSHEICRRYVGYTERVLRRRMEARDLLDHPEEGWVRR